MKADNVREESRERTMAKGAISLALSVILVKIIGFIYKVPLSHILGDEGMGYFNSAYTIFTFFYMLCSGGVPRAVSIMVTEMSVKERASDAHRILSVALKIFVAIGVLFTAVFIIFSSFFSTLIGNSLASFSLVCIAPSLTFVAASGVLRGYLNGKGKLVFIAAAEVIDSGIKFIVGLAFAILAVKLGYTAPMISAFTVIGVTLGSFFGSLFLYICAKINISEEKTKQNTNSELSAKAIMTGILKISVPITLSSAIMGISNVIDLGMIIKRLVVSGIPTETAVSLYGNFTTLAVPMLNLVMALISPLSASALPHLTENYVLKKKNEFSAFTERVIQICATLSLPLAFAFVFFSQEILMLLFNDASAKIAAPLLTLLAPSVFFMPMLTISNTVLEASLHTKSPLIAMSVGAVFKLVISYVLIGIPEIGICGAPIGTGVYYAVSLVISAVMMLSFCKVKISSFLSLWRPLIGSFLAVFGARMIYNSISRGIYTHRIFLICVGIAVVFYIMFFCIFMQKEMRKISYFVKINKKGSK